ncbi:MAG: PorT family protein [Bacteroidales bacterium]|nr:PorT family protein [Bacteroidales bacterium]
MVKHIKLAALLLFISLSMFLSIPVHAQGQEGGGFNNRKVLYGLHWGFTENSVDLYYSDIEGFAHPLDPDNHSFFALGTRLNVMYDVRLGNYFRLRVMPGVSLTGRTWEPVNVSVPTSSSVEYKVKSVCGELPVDVKFYPFRCDQLYLTSGLSYSFDFTSLDKDIDEGTIQRLNAHDIRYTCGVGFDFDTHNFRLGVELKATFGLPSSDIILGTRPDAFYYHNGPTFGFGFIIEA